MARLVGGDEDHGTVAHQRPTRRSVRDRVLAVRDHRRQRAKEKAQGTFWELYESLKQYRLNPRPNHRQRIEQRFDRLCRTKTGYPDLNAALGLLHAKRDEFLAVLEYPHLPLHNNLAENDIREYARVQGGDERLTSDSGVLLLREADQRLGLVESLTQQLRDPRQQHLIRCTLPELLRERIYSLAQGYPAQDDLDRLAHDPALRISVESSRRTGARRTLGQPADPVAAD